MAQTHKTVRVEPGSELDHVLSEAGETPIELEQHGVRYRVTRIGLPDRSRTIALADDHNIWAGYDPERVRHSLRRNGSAVRGVDRDQLKRDLAAQRVQDSSGRPA